VRRRPHRHPLAAALIAALLAGGCGARARLTLPSGPGEPLADGPTLAETLFGHCRDLRTLTAEIGLSGRAGREKLRGKLIAGFRAPGALRLEAVAPFGQPVFILAAAPGHPTMLLPRDNRVLRDASPDAILEALAGVSLAPDDLLALVAGCPMRAPDLRDAIRYGPDWAGFTVADRKVYVRQREDAWQLAAIVLPAMTAEYAAFEDRQPATVRLIGKVAAEDRGRVDVTLALSQVEVNVTVPDEAFTVKVPPDAAPLTLDELRQAGPMRDVPAAGAPAS
jgi:outer membrane lipoprotein-sorting protein